MSTFNYPVTSSSGQGIVKYATAGDLPAVATNGDTAIVTDTDKFYEYDSGLAQWIELATYAKSTLLDNFNGNNQLVKLDGSAKAPDSILSTNVPLKNTSNTFTQTNTFTDIDADFIDVKNNAADPAYVEGRFFYDQTEKALSYYNDINGVKINLGQETVIRVVNKTGYLIPNGKMVYISGAQGDRPRIALARADSSLTSEGTIGMATNDIADNDTGYVTIEGLVHDLNTNAFNSGDIIYLSTTSAGDYTNVRPSAPDYQIMIGVVTKKDASSGHIFVSVREMQDKIRAVVEGGTGSNTSSGARQNLVTQQTFSGIENESAFLVTYNSATRIFSVVSTNGVFYANGTRFTRNTTETTTAHANTTGIRYLYYNSSGALTVSSTVWDLATTAPLSAVYYNATTALSTIMLNEKHPAGSGMDDATHKYLHETRGTQFVRGLTASAYTLSSSVNNTAVTPNALDYAISSGVIADEDLYTNISQLSDGGPYSVFYRTGATGEWVVNTAAQNGILNVGGDIAYNQFTAGAWQQTALGANNRWVNYFIFAVQSISPTTGLPIRQIAAAQGQTFHTSLTNAQSETPNSISGFSDLTMEVVFLYRVSYRRMSATNSQIESFQQITGNLVTISGTFSSTSHNALSNRSDANSHPASAISTDVTNFTNLLSASDTDVQTALNTLNNARIYNINLDWNNDGTLNAREFTEQGQTVYGLYRTSPNSTVNVRFKVPWNYVFGTQLSLSVKYYSLATSLNVNFDVTSYLFQDNTTAYDNPTNSQAFSSLATANSAPSGNYKTSVVAVTSSTGTINGVAIARGDVIQVNLQTGSLTTDTSEIRVIPFMAEVKQ